jgi:probable F420-dependent oxidoreductase
VNLTRFGIWTSYRAIGQENAAEAARLIQDLGFGAVWLGGSPDPDELRPLLAATETLVTATGITNIWVSDPAVVAAPQAAIVSEYGAERSLIGIGAGHPEATSDYTRPRHATIKFLDALDAARTPLPTEQRVLAALGPKMLDLSGERSIGTHPYFTSVDHTQYCRQRLGAGALVAPEVACVIDSDAERARAAARAYAKLYLGLSNYTNNLLRFGFTEDDIADGGSDRLIDAVVPQGSAEDIAAVVAAHLDAGADHVCVQTVGVQGVPREQWTALAGALGL